MQISSIGKQKKEEPSKARKYVLIGIIISAILLVLVFVLLMVYGLMKKNAPKALTLNIDGEQKTFTEGTFIFSGDNLYISLKDIAGAIGYRYYDGEYKKYTQNKDKCYLECDEEIASFELGSDKVYKTLSDQELNYYELSMDEPVVKKDDKLYVISSGLMQGCNLYITYNKSENQILMSTLNGVYNNYTSKVAQYDSIEGISIDYLDGSFNNKKAILYGMLVVKSKIKNVEKYGVISLDGKTVYLPINHDYVEFMESSQDFLVSIKTNNKSKYGIKYKDGETKLAINYDKIEIIDNINLVYYVEMDGKKGLLKEDGKPKIDIIYDKIEVLDSTNELYYVENNGKKGVLNGDGQPVLYVEYDQIGIDENKFPNDNIENSKLLYGKYIPANRYGYWGLYNIETRQFTDFNLEEIGYISNSRVNEGNILLIEEIEGIVAKKDGRYGIITKKSNGVFKVAPVFDGLSYETENGKTSYYLVFGSTKYEVNEYLELIDGDSSQQEDEEEQTEDEDIQEEQENDEV